jgi:hypothetical protein
MPKALLDFRNWLALVSYGSSASRPMADATRPAGATGRVRVLFTTVIGEIEREDPWADGDGLHGWKRAPARIVEQSHLDCRKPVRRFLRFNRVAGTQPLRRMSTAPTKVPAAADGCKNIRLSADAV